MLLSKLSVINDPLATAQKILENESLFRLGLMLELILSLGLVFLAFALYKILKTVNKKLAFLAFSIKIVEAVLM